MALLNSASGTITGSQAVQITCEGMSTTTLTISGSWTGTINFQAQLQEGAPWFTVFGLNLSSNNGVSVSSTTANDTFTFNVASYFSFRAIGGTVTGTASLAINAIEGTNSLLGIQGTVSTSSGPQPGVDIGDVTVNNGAGASAVNIQDGGNSITVDGPLTDSELRASPVDVSIVSIVASSVSVTNGAGASAVNIQDGGNSITVDGPLTDGQLRATPVPISGTVNAAQSGTWNVNNVSGTVSLPTGAATSALQTTGNTSLNSIDTKLTDKSQFTKITDGTDTALVNAAGSLQTTLHTSTGLEIKANPDAALFISPPGSVLSNEIWQTLSSTRWFTGSNSSGATASQGVMTLNVGTSGGSYSWVRSNWAILPTGVDNYIKYSTVLTVDADLKTGAYRYFGCGTATAAAPTITAALRHGAGFGFSSSDGKLYADIWSNSTLVAHVDIDAFRPTDGLAHTYSVYFSSRKCHFVIDGVTATTIENFLTGALFTVQMQILHLAVNSPGGASPEAIYKVNASSLTNTSDNMKILSSGDYNGRTVYVTAGNQLQVFSEGYRNTFAASKTGLVPASNATDIFTITGSATATVRVHKVRISGTQTTGGIKDVQIILRSTANSGGTSQTVSSVCLNSIGTGASAVVRTYTANPTLGTTAGIVRSTKLSVPGLTGTKDSEVFDFNDNGGLPIVLAGTSQVLAVNLNGVTTTGGSYNISIEWTEE